MDHLVEFNRKLCLPHRILCWHFPLHLGLFLSGISPYILLTLRFPGWKNELCTHYNGQLLSSLSFYHCKWRDTKKGHFGPLPGRTLCNSVPSLTYRAICTTHQICPIAPLLSSLTFFKKKWKAWFCHYLCPQNSRLLQDSLYLQYLKLCFFLSFRLKSFISSPCMWPISQRRPSLAQQSHEKGIRIDSPWCKLECSCPITSPSRSTNETSHRDTSDWASICVPHCQWLLFK